MDKQTLEDVNQILANEYLNKKEQILKDETSGEIGSCRATELRTKLVGMMMAVEIIQKEINNIKEYNYKCRECNHIVYKNDIIRATKNYLDIIPQYNIDRNIRVCPSCGTIFENDYGFESVTK